MKSIIFHKDTLFHLFAFQRKFIDQMNFTLNKKFNTLNKNYFYPSSNFYMEIPDQIDFLNYQLIQITGPKKINADYYLECRIISKHKQFPDITKNLLIAKCILEEQQLQNQNDELKIEFSDDLNFNEELKVFQCCTLNHTDNCNYVTEQKWVKLN